jgi:hypothetical protein
VRALLFGRAQTPRSRPGSEGGSNASCTLPRVSVDRIERKSGAVFKVRYRDAQGRSRSVTLTDEQAARGLDDEMRLARRQAREQAAVRRAHADARDARF